MSFVFPRGFTAVPVVANGDVAYDYAVRSLTRKLEIRYRVIPAQEKGQPIPLELMVITMGLNISHGKRITPAEYAAADVRAEFHADTGWTGVVTLDSDFGKGYQWCLMSAIEKLGRGRAFVFFLYDNPDDLTEVFGTNDAFHSLTFH